MPGSDELYGGTPPLELSLFGPQSPQSETSHLAAPMFPNIVENPDIPFGPSPEELEQQKMEAVRFSKGVKIKDIVVETFDLNDPEQVEEYKKVQKRMLILMAQEAIHVTTWEKIKVLEPKPGFVVHIDYIEYGLEKKDHATGQKTLDGEVIEEQAT